MLDNSRTCPLPMITPQSRFLLKLHAHYRNALLPVKGGILDQPHYYAEAMEILSGRTAQIMAEKAEKQRRNGGN